ncbi:TrkH family potassium uptake protein [Paenibacillus chitinolyticus]|uniref:TrkH family potassium uptake protein n=1 Tax=Paenibacillus chitinolyticus TaxID=79263 RepID=UPI002DB7167A|nr:TrkH family potassium uptake protein [Paenibacillus chitinolyticus]MEC0245352.1 TrkH family potassium uptake protein [Paenibacillus chitinolyticus]
MGKKRRILIRFTPPQILALGILAIILIGSVLLSLPAASSTGEPISYLDAFFMSTSAACVTGLSVLNAGVHFSLFGQIVILMLVQVGGLGFMTMATLIALVLRKRITLKERLLLQEAMNQGSVEGIVRLIRKVLTYALAIELAGAVLLTVRWAFDMPLGQAVYFGVFHSISTFNNAGFDLFSSLPGAQGSLMAYVNDPYVNIVVIGLMILGGIGFIVIADLLDFKRTRQLTLHSKVVLTATGLLILLGSVVVFIFEYTNPLTMQPLSLSGKIFAAFFQSATTRSTGMNTIDIESFRQATQFFVIILMFIGAAPGSAGGGIKITTFAILLGAVITMVRGKEDIVFFRKRLPEERIYKATTLTLMSLILVVAGTMILSVLQDGPFIKILFEVTSAFGTAGISLGLTPELTSPSKVLMAILMFAGRLGPLTLAYALTPKGTKELYRYPEGKITIG